MSVPRGLPKEIKEVVRHALRSGWSVEVRRSNHLKWTAPDGRTVYFSSGTPSDYRMIRNLRRDLMARGLPPIDSESRNTAPRM